MKNKFISILSWSIIFFLPTLLDAQEQNIIAKFVITDARINKIDCTKKYLDENAYIVFYISSKGEFEMANVMPKSNTQSFGNLYSSKNTKEDETNKSYQVDYFSYTWSYKNSYNDKVGTADVTLGKIYKPQGTIFSCLIITESLDIIEYKGYMKGTIDFSKFQIL